MILSKVTGSQFLWALRPMEKNQFLVAREEGQVAANPPPLLTQPCPAFHPAAVELCRGCNGNRSKQRHPNSLTLRSSLLTQA